MPRPTEPARSAGIALPGTLGFCYLRHDENLGAAANYNLVLALARAPFFKWHAHDDQLAPDCLERSVAALASDPQAVACITGALRLDSRGREVLRWDLPLHGSELSDPAVRFGAIVRTFYCNWTEIFSVMRRSAITRTMQHRAFRGSDIAMLAELALLGPFVRIDAPLFIHRDHAARYYNSVDSDPAAVLAWYDPKRGGDRVWHKWALYRSHLAAISTSCFAFIVKIALLRPATSVHGDVGQPEGAGPGCRLVGGPAPVDRQAQAAALAAQAIGWLPANLRGTAMSWSGTHAAIRPPPLRWARAEWPTLDIRKAPVPGRGSSQPACRHGLARRAARRPEPDGGEPAPAPAGRAGLGSGAGGRLR